MILVGLTGGIASGKSTVSRFFQKEGAFVVDADEIAHAVLRKGCPAYQPVIKAFGKAILDAQGEIDRKKLGKIVFRHPGQLAKLSKIIHPMVFEHLDAEKEKIRQKQPKSVVLFDAPLLIEANAHKKMDRVVLVYVDRKTQLARLMARDALTKAEAALRIEAQMPINDKVPFADEVIHNEKPRDLVKKDVHCIYERLLKKA
ncbi:MAG: dephospho-CoA kinase [Nitrospiria bacterium]